MVINLRMKTVPLGINNRPITTLPTRLRTRRIATVLVLSILAALGLMGLVGSAALAQVYVYSPCAHSPPYLEPPYPWWQILDGGTPYAEVTGNNCLWYHTVNTMVPGQGWGIIHTYSTEVGAVYEVEIHQPAQASPAMSSLA